MNKVRELKEKRASLIAEMRSILDAAEKENRDLTGEEESKYEELEKELEKIDSEIKREERFSRIKSFENSIDETEAEDDRKEAFVRYLKTGDYRELRFLNTQSVDEGGALVPTEFYNRVVEALLADSVMRPLCRVIQTTTTTTIPVVVSHSSAAWIGEGEQYGGENPIFDRVNIKAHKLGALIKVSEELVQDSGINIESYLANELGRVFAAAEDQAFIAGNGRTMPRGIVQDATAAVQTSSSDKITGDELVDLIYSLPLQYRRNSIIIMNDSTVRLIRKLKDTTGQYLWQPGLAAGQPDKILGIPVYTSPYMPEVQSGAKAVVVFDPSYYVIADRGTLEILVLRERFADFGQIGYRATKRVDGKLLVQEAAAALVIGG